MSNEDKRKQLRGEYVSRINRVLDYIESNLSSPLTLKELAGVACFSPYHFHRIFGAMVGEPLSQFIQRLRLEKAATRLVAYPDESITEIALDCGFSGSSAFARAFKETFGQSATEWREGGWKAHSNMGKMKSKEGKTNRNLRQEYIVTSEYIDGVPFNLKWRITMKESKGNLKADVTVKDYPGAHVAYVRHIGPYAGNEELFKGLFEKLMKWAGPRGLIRFPETQCMSVYHDDPNLTDENKLRTSICLTVPEDTEVGGEIGMMEIPKGQYAFAHFEINADQYGDAWDTVCGGWLPESGYQPDDRPMFEIYLNNPNDHPEKKHIVEICVPVKPM